MTPSNMIRLVTVLIAAGWLCIFAPSFAQSNDYLRQQQQQQQWQRQQEQQRQQQDQQRQQQQQAERQRIQDQQRQQLQTQQRQQIQDQQRQQLRQQQQTQQRQQMQTQQQNAQRQQLQQQQQNQQRQAQQQANQQQRGQLQQQGRLGKDGKPTGMVISGGVAKMNRPLTPGEIQRGFTGKVTSDGRALIRFQGRVFTVPASRVSVLSARFAANQNQESSSSSRPSIITTGVRARLLSETSGKAVSVRLAAAKLARRDSHDDSVGAMRSPIPDEASKRPMLVSNPKHHINSRSPEPSNVRELYNNSIVDDKGVRWAKDENGIVHRFSTDNNGLTHWNGSTDGDKPISSRDIPNIIKKELGVKK